MPRVSPKVNQSLTSSTRNNKGNRSNQIRNGGQIAVIKNGGTSGSGGSSGRRNHSGQSTLPSSPNNSGYVPIRYVICLTFNLNKVQKTIY